MKCRSAASKDDALQLAELFVRAMEACESGSGFLGNQSSLHGFAQSVRLLMDFLEHVVGKKPFSCGARLHLDFSELRRSCRAARYGDQMEGLAIKRGDVLILQVDDILHPAIKGCGIAGNELGILSDPQHQWTPAARGG